MTMRAAVAGALTAAWGRRSPVCRVAAPLTLGYQGTGLPTAARTRVAGHAATPKAISLLPTTAVVFTDDVAGFRSWSPPV